MPKSPSHSLNKIIQQLLFNPYITNPFLTRTDEEKKAFASWSDFLSKRKEETQQESPLSFLMHNKIPDCFKTQTAIGFFKQNLSVFSCFNAPDIISILIAKAQSFYANHQKEEALMLLIVVFKLTKNTPHEEKMNFYEKYITYRLLLDFIVDARPSPQIQLLTNEIVYVIKQNNELCNELASSNGLLNKDPSLKTTFLTYTSKISNAILKTIQSKTSNDDKPLDKIHLKMTLLTVFVDHISTHNKEEHIPRANDYFNNILQAVFKPISNLLKQNNCDTVEKFIEKATNESVTHDVQNASLSTLCNDNLLSFYYVTSFYLQSYSIRRLCHNLNNDSRLSLSDTTRNFLSYIETGEFMRYYRLLHPELTIPTTATNNAKEQHASLFDLSKKILETYQERTDSLINETPILHNKLPKTKPLLTYLKENNLYKTVHRIQNRLARSTLPNNTLLPNLVRQLQEIHPLYLSHQDEHLFISYLNQLQMALNLQILNNSMSDTTLMGDAPINPLLYLCERIIECMLYITHIENVIQSSDANPSIFQSTDYLLYRMIYDCLAQKESVLSAIKTAFDRAIQSDNTEELIPLMETIKMFSEYIELAINTLSKQPITPCMPEEPSSYASHILNFFHARNTRLAPDEQRKLELGANNALQQRKEQMPFTDKVFKKRDETSNLSCP